MRKQAQRIANMNAFNRFYRKLIVISLLFEIFRRLNVHFTPFKMQNVVHAICRAETSTAARNSQPFPRYGRKLIRYFGLARYYISSFKRTFYSILYADRSGRGFPSWK